MVALLVFCARCRINVKEVWLIFEREICKIAESTLPTPLMNRLHESSSNMHSYRMLNLFVIMTVGKLEYCIAQLAFGQPT